MLFQEKFAIAALIFLALMVIAILYTHEPSHEPEWDREDDVTMFKDKLNITLWQHNDHRWTYKLTFNTTINMNLTANLTKDVHYKESFSIGPNEGHDIMLTYDKNIDIYLSVIWNGTEEIRSISEG